MSNDPVRSLSDAAASGPGTIRTQFDWAATAPSVAVIETVAVATDQDPYSMASLYSNVDPDALDALFTSDSRSSSEGDLRVTFSYQDTDVTVVSDGEIIAKPPQSGR